MAYNFSLVKKELADVEEWLKKEYLQISTGRANPALLDSVSVESYGTYSPIKNIASITIEDARTIRVSPWDKGVIKDIETAIRDSGLPLSATADGNGLRISVPQLTAESKIPIVKLCKEKLEESRITVRDIRRICEKDIEAREKAAEFGEDDKFRAKEDLQKLVEEANGKLENLFDKKEEDITSV
ncbi:MAG: Frr, ribosome recycling factor [Patescibacteria group bacterium]|nr:Frr, ribosome recycling factor [Patescibacteria group bacterium]